MRGWGVGLVACFLLASCSSTSGGGGLMGSVFGSAAQEVMRQGMGSIASSATVTSATQGICGNDLWGMCHNMTASVLSGFTDEFVKRMTQEDVQQATAAREQAIRTGQAQSWQNPQTGASGFVQTEPTTPRPPTPTPVKVRKDRVGTPPEMDAVGEMYVVIGARGANVRGGPATSFAVVESLPNGEQIRAIGKVRTSDWYMIGRGDVAMGYVAGSLIQRADALVPVATPSPPAPSAQEAAQVEEVQVVMAAECYTTNQRVTLGDGTSEEATVTSCRTPNGWAQV